MSDRTPRLRNSVFARLVAIMVIMAATLLVLVGAFFWAMVIPDVHESLTRVIEQYSRVVAATSPDFPTAKRLMAPLDMHVRYEGPRGNWTTLESLPSASEVKYGHHPMFGPVRYVVPAPDGGTYLFSWSIGRKLYAAHQLMLVLLFVLMGVVFVAAYAILRGLLRPLRVLGDGVAQLSEGQLDVVVPSWRRDEFGVLAEGFNAMVGRVRDMIRARDQLLLDVSHELRSPIARMKVALELLPEDRNRARMADDLVEMESMITEILELERLREGRSIHPRRQDLVPVLREMAERFEDRQPGVRIVAMPQSLQLDIDAERMRSVFRNILENAVKYSLPDSRAVEISVLEARDHVVIRITDDGPGIPPEDLGRLFEPFFRADRSRSRKTGGYGLGLSICKRIVEGHGGGITAENNTGRGSTFVVTLPKGGG
jgi:signal transduction histidine kinase